MSKGVSRRDNDKELAKRGVFTVKQTGVKL